MISSGLGPEHPGEPDDFYAPPKSEPGGERWRLTIGHVPFELGPILRASWTIFRENLGTCLAIGWVALGLLAISQYLQRLVAEDLAPDPADRFAYFLTQFGSFFSAWVFNAWVMIGQNLALLGVVRGEGPALPRLFQGFPFLLTSLIAGLFFAMAVGTVTMVFLVWGPIAGGIAGPGSGAGLLAQALSIVGALGAAMYVATRLSQYSLMILEEHAGSLDSLRFSWQATRGRVATLFLIWLLLGTINLAGLLACFVGLLVTIPFTYLFLVVTFLSLIGRPIGPAKDQPETGMEFLD